MNTSIYDDLRERSTAGEIVFHLSTHALHDDTNNSPNSLSTDIQAEETFFHHFNADTYADMSEGLDLTPNERNVWIQQSIVAHVKGDMKWIKRDLQLDYPAPPYISRSRARRDSGTTNGSLAPSQATDVTCVVSLIDFQEPMGDNLAGDNDDEDALSSSDLFAETTDSATQASPWVAMYGNFDWVIHRITRVLARRDAVRITLSVIDTKNTYPELFTKSSDHLGLLRQQQSWGSAERQAITEAKRYAENSREVLFYGKVFAHSIVEIFDWTSERYPFDLPWYFFRDIQRMPIPKSWLYRLVWQPPAMPFTLAEVRMDDRRNGRLLSVGAGKSGGLDRGKGLYVGRLRG